MIRPERLGSATQKWSVLWYAATIGLNKARYDPISAATDVPWFVIGIIHGLECSFDFSRHLFNGDPLDDYTKRYPAGYPRDRGAPPFSFAASAISALRYDHLDGHQDWTLARTLHRLEQYNGLSYRTKLKMASPYLWSFTTLYDIGKFKEIPRPGGGYQSVYDPNLRSKQCGAGTMLKALLDARTLPAMA